MRLKSSSAKATAGERVVKDIRRTTCIECLPDHVLLSRAQAINAAPKVGSLFGLKAHLLAADRSLLSDHTIGNITLCCRPASKRFLVI
jgi:hypothetical protein